MKLNLDIPALKKKALIFTPAVLVAVITVMLLIATILMAVLDDAGDTLYALLLFIPCAIGALLVDVFLRILFRKDVKFKALYI